MATTPRCDRQQSEKLKMVRQLTGLKNQTEKETPKPARSKAHNEGEKLVIRRLPPGMTEAEFVSILGPDWELSKGKVDWLSYAPGKVSHE